jgi:hypothetical protein
MKIILLFLLFTNFCSIYLPIKNWVNIKHKKNSSLDHLIQLKFQNGYKWQGSPIKNTLGKESKSWFFVILDNKLVKIFLPEEIIFNKIEIDFWAQKIIVYYKINGQEMVHQDDYNILLDMDLLFNQIQDHNSIAKEVLDKIPRESIFINHDITPKFISNEVPVKNLFTVKKNPKNLDHVTYIINEKSPSLEVFFNKDTKKISKYLISYENQVIYEDNLEHNSLLSLNRYPLSFDLGPHKDFLKTFNDFIQDQWETMEVVVTDSYFYQENNNKFSFYKYIKNFNPHKKYCFLVVPVERNFINNKELGKRNHLFPVGFLLEKFNEVWILKKIFINDTCITEFLYLNNDLDFILQNLLNANENILKKKLNKDKADINNLVINKFSYKTGGNTYVEMTKFFQMRQIAASSCYISIYKDILRLCDCVHHYIDNTKHPLDNLNLGIKDLMVMGNFFFQYDNWNPIETENFFKNFIINYQSNLNFHNIDGNFIGVIKILSNKNFGPLKNAENAIFGQKNLKELEQLYCMFFIKMNNEVFTFLICRKDEDKLNNQRYYDQLKSQIIHYYPHWIVHPLIIIKEKDFNGKWDDYPWNKPIKNKKDAIDFQEKIALKCLYNVLFLNLQLPDIYMPLKELSLSNPIKNNNNYYFFNFIIRNTYKSVLIDVLGDLYFSILVIFYKSSFNWDFFNKKSMDKFKKDFLKNKSDDFNENHIKILILNHLLKNKSIKE